jgi:methylated-DNA-[protein]-cysteine S-methyltransferase
MGSTRHRALFDTAIGRCGVLWSEHGIVAVQLPEARDAATRARMVERFGAAEEAVPPAGVQAALAGIAALLRGEASDLSGIVLDMEGVPAFHRRVYQEARAIPPGSTLSYGEIAARAGAPGGARAAGQALRRNPFAIVVPCHRVLAAGGRLGGFTASGGVATKLAILARERSFAAGAATLDFDPLAAVAHLRAADARLARLIDAVGPLGLALKHAPSVFGALGEAIVYQQLNGRAAAAIFARVCALFPRAHEGLDARQLLRASDARLRGAGLSQAKLLALRDLARKALRGEVPELEETRSMDDDEIVARLTQVRGVGRWTAQMFLIFRLGRPDVLPVDDYGVRKGFAVTFEKPDASNQDLERRGARWRPYRTAASWYLWRAAERANARLTPP